MDFIQDSIRENYLRGVNNLVGKGIVDDNMRKTIISSNTDKAKTMPQVYYLLTRGLIEKMSSDECKLSDNLKRALSEAIGIKLWDDFSGIYMANDSIMPENYVQRFVGETLMNNIGERETSILALKNPDFFGEFLDTIPYEQETFLSYVTRKLDEAARQQTIVGDRRNGIGNSDFVLDCVDAIITCSDKLSLPRKRRNKVLEKEKNKGKTNEREYE